MPRPARYGIQGLRRDANGCFLIEHRRYDPVLGKRVSLHRESLPAGTGLALARERARVVLNFIVLGEQQGKAKSERRVTDVLADYLTWSSAHNRPSTYRMKAWCAREITARFGAKRLDEMNAGLVGQWAGELHSRGCGAATINRHVATLKHLLTWCEANQLVAHETAASVRRARMMREPPHRVRYMSRAEVRAVLAQCREPLRSVVILALNSGLRQGELCALRLGDVDFDARHLHVRDSKSGKARFVPLNDAALRALRRLCRGSRKPTDPVIRTMCRKRGLSQWGLVSAWRRALADSGVSNLRFHDLRHHFASMLAQKGVSMAVIASLLGHAKGTGLQMTLRYAHLAEAALRHAVDKLR